MIMNNDFNPERVALSIDIEELYDLDVTIARFMIYAFERIACQTEEDTPEYKAYIKAIWNNEEDLADLKRDAKASLKPISEGLSLFHKYYRSLWW